MASLVGGRSARSAFGSGASSGARVARPPRSEVRVEGIGLHSGARSSVVLRARPGPVTLAAAGQREVPVEDLRVVSTDRATTVEGAGGAVRVSTVEHLFAALSARRVYAGLAIAVDGPEMPLLDGGAATWCKALAALDLAPAAARMSIARQATLQVGASLYELTPLSSAPAAVHVEVELELDDPRVGRTACWRGDADEFVAHIAPARTFALARDLGDLLRAGLVRHVDPASAVLIAPEGIHCAGRAFSADEPARHKLLDLLGDLYLYGGPPLGRLRAVRPGHTPNARALRRAIDEGLVVPVGSARGAPGEAP